MGSFDAAYVCRETGDFISRYRLQNPRTVRANESHQDFKQAVDGRIFRFLSFSEKILEPQMGQRDSLSVADSSFECLTLEVNPKRNATTLSVFSRRGSKKSPIAWLLKLNTTKPGDGHSGGNMHHKLPYFLTNSFFLHLLIVWKENIYADSTPVPTILAASRGFQYWMNIILQY